MKIQISLIVVVCIATATGCYYDKEETLYGRKIDCASVSYKYSVEVGPLITSNCATSGCHDATNAGNVTLQSYTQVTEHLTRINQRVVIDRTMPPGGGMTTQQVSVIECWIANGALQ